MADWTEQDGPDEGGATADEPKEATPACASEITAELTVEQNAADIAEQSAVQSAGERAFAAAGDESGAADLSAARGADAEPVPPADGNVAETPDPDTASGPALDAMAEIVAALDADDASEEFTRSSAELKAIVEALIFASPDPLTPRALVKLLDGEPKEDVLAAVDELKQDYERPGGLQMVEVAGGYQIVTRSDLHEWVRRLFHERSTQKLSVQALETLAVIAYRQPITAIEITEIRGVNTSGVLNTLLERHLVKIVGRKQVVGRPFMYATTKEFLIRFGLKDLTDLPRVEDMAESLGIESSLLVERTPAEAQLPLSEPDAEDGGDQTLEPESLDVDDVSDDQGPSVH